MAFRSIPEDVTREWFDTEQVGPLAFELPEPDIDYAYAAARLLSFYPIVNSKGATYFPDDIDDELLGTLVGKQANLEHDKTRIVGTIFAYRRTDEGIDIGVRIDRECANLQGMDLEEMRSGNYFSHVSVELTKDPEQSWYLGVDDGFNIVSKVPVLAGREQGIRRTTRSDPYMLMGNRVVERIKPARFTGVGFVPNPADKTAALYAVAASDDSVDKEKPPVDGGEPQSANADDSIMENESMNEAELKARIEALESDVARLTTEKEQASTEATNRVTEIQAELDAAKAALAAKETELASVTSERDQLVTEKETAAREARVNTLVDELVAILPAKDDAELATLRETAAQYIDEHGVIHSMKLERRNAALEAKIAELTAAPAPEEKPEDKPEDKPEGKEGEQASDDELTPPTSRHPKVALGGVYAAKSDKNYSKEELNAVF